MQRQFSDREIIMAQSKNDHGAKEEVLMKTLNLVILLIAFIFSPLAGYAKVRVVTTTSDLAALTREVGGDLVEVESIGKGYENPHFVDAKPSHMLKIGKADLFIKIGLDLEIWSSLLLDGARNPKVMPGTVGYLDASKGAEILDVPTQKLDRSSGDIHLLGNPHYWLDPANGKVMARNIADALKQIDPGHAATYEQNKRQFMEKIDASMQRWTQAMKPYAGTKIVTYHSSFPNFTRRFGLQVVGFVEPKPGIAPSPAHIASLINLMKQEKVRLILMEPYYSGKVAEMVAKETGAQLLVIPPSVGGVPEVKSYDGLFDYIIGKIVGALSGGRRQPTDGGGKS